MISMKQVLIAGAVLANLTIGAVGIAVWPPILWLYLFVGPTSLVMIHDLVQCDHAVLRNYPVVGHFRYMVEDFRHQFRQYLIESDAEGEPFNHAQRAVVYQRSKNVSDVLPFGTIRNVYAEGYEWFHHSMAPLEPLAEEPRVQVGNEQTAKPYLASRFNISAMSFGSLSSNAILALNRAAAAGGFYHDTGEGGISRYHAEPGGDLVWELGTGYFGCRAADGSFDVEQFADTAQRDNVRMIEVKLSQGAKPGGGGVLPGIKVSPAIAEARGVPVGETVHSPPAHSAFSSPVGLLEFLQTLRERSGGKPVGFKLCIGLRRQFMAVVKAMLETGILPDFITVDGGEGGTGAAQIELSNSVGMPLIDALIFVRNALHGAGLRERIRIIASGKIIDGFDIASRVAVGADITASARGMMFSLGCIQARRCHTNRCPVGVATQDPWRVNGLSVPDKATRVANYHAATMQHFLLVLASTGLDHPDKLCPKILFQRTSRHDISSYADLYPEIEATALIEGDAHRWYQQPWDEADPGRF